MNRDVKAKNVRSNCPPAEPSCLPTISKAAVRANTHLVAPVDGVVEALLVLHKRQELRSSQGYSALIDHTDLQARCSNTTAARVGMRPACWSEIHTKHGPRHACTQKIN
jgi:hypothetical protein